MLNILILYDINSVHVKTTYEHLFAFQLFSKHKIYYVSAFYDAKCDFDLSSFDVIIVHYSIRFIYDHLLSPEFKRALEDYKGYKVFFTQDEYENTEKTRFWMEKFKFDLVFTCVPIQSIYTVYPFNRFPNTLFKHNLTGYVPINYERLKIYTQPIKQRKSLIGYRGRSLSFWYGSLCQEKGLIGIRMREFCMKHSITVDIETSEDSRIYGEDWYRFLASHKATLGTESGSNIFDDYGHIRENVKKDLEDNPNQSFEEIYNKHLREHEGKIIMNQISPKIFEAIALKTALILFEGNYSGIIQPNIHYIPLKKDFSNITQVMEKLHDDHFLQNMVDFAYQDILETDKYSYKKFIADFDKTIDNFVEPKNYCQPVDIKYQSFEENVSQKGVAAMLEKPWHREFQITTQEN